jgi:hypothetical protein
MLENYLKLVHDRFLSRSHQFTRNNRTAQHVSNVSTFRCGSAGVVWYPKDTTPPQLNHTVTPTHIEPQQYNT